MAKDPLIGRDFPLEVEVIDARTRNFVAKTRAALAATIVLAALLAIAVCAIFAMFNSDFSPLSTTWSIVAMPVGAIIGHYFGKAKSNEKNDD